jgi:shikimate kinase
MKIYLIGYMGCGKSTIGKKLAKLLSYKFIDLDNFIEQEEKQSISDIFNNRGEVEFRKIESNKLVSLSNEANVVISLGGGTPCFNENMKFIVSSGTAIFIKMPVNAIFNRLKGAKQTRPLVAEKDDDELLAYITEQLLVRTPFYDQAALTISGLDVSSTVLQQLSLKLLAEAN